MAKIRVGIVGVGNCASSLVQGVEYYRHGSMDPLAEHPGLMHYDLAGYLPHDLEISCAFDIDERKVGQPLHRAIFAKPNKAVEIWPDLPDFDVTVEMGPVLDGVSEHMADYPPDETFLPSDRPAVDVAKILKATSTEVVISYLPVGSQQAAEFYAQACLDTGTSLVNCMPVFLISDGVGERFTGRGIPRSGEISKPQVGPPSCTAPASLSPIVHQVDRTYGLTGGNNTTSLTAKPGRLGSKGRKPGTVSPSRRRLRRAMSIGPSTRSPGGDNRFCFLRLSWQAFGNILIELELPCRCRAAPTPWGRHRRHPLLSVGCIAGSLVLQAFKIPPRKHPPRSRRSRPDQSKVHQRRNRELKWTRSAGWRILFRRAAPVSWWRGNHEPMATPIAPERDVGQGQLCSVLDCAGGFRRRIRRSRRRLPVGLTPDAATPLRFNDLLCGAAQVWMDVHGKPEPHRMRRTRRLGRETARA
jgi:myo-inositol-1-phosphate synthase